MPIIKKDHLLKTDDTGMTSYELDLLSRVKSVKYSNGNTVKYDYDQVGNESSITYPDNSKTIYTYDNVNNIQTVTDKNGVTNYIYDSVGMIKEIATPDGVNEYRKYDAEGNVIEIAQKEKKQISKKTLYTYHMTNRGILPNMLIIKWIISQIMNMTV